MDKVTDYLKDRYEEEQARFNHFENKCSRFLTYLTVMISVLFFLAKSSLDRGFSPSTVLDWIACIIFVIVSIGAASSWGNSLLAIKVADSANLPRTRETFDYMKRSSADELEDYMYRCYVDTIESLIEKIDGKSKHIELAYNDLVFSAWGSALLMILVLINS